MKKVLISFMAVAVLSVIMVSGAYAWNSKVHGTAAYDAVYVLRGYTAAYNDAYPYRLTMANGSLAEDEASVIAKSNHYYLAGDFKDMIKIWLENARYYYPGNKGTGYHYLGRAMHRVEDASCPYHAYYWWLNSHINSDHDNNGQNDHKQMDDLCGQSYYRTTDPGVRYWSNSTSAWTVASNAADEVRYYADYYYSTYDNCLHNKQYSYVGSLARANISNSLKQLSGMIRWMNQK